MTLKSYPDIVGFVGERVYTKGYVNLLTTFDTRESH